jgi:4-hydroxy-tetrahydrodipicolinate reductase
MGQAIAASVQQHADLELAGIWQRGEDIDPLLAAADVLIDFSLPEATEGLLAAVVRHQKPLVCGVSGLDDQQLRLLEEASTTVPLVFDRNMSLGIAVLERSVREAAASLGSEFEMQVSEVHHVHKKDAPSGTALKLGEAIALSRGSPSDRLSGLRHQDPKVGVR